MFTKDWREKWLPGPPHACSLYSEDSIFRRPWVCPVVFPWVAVLALTLFGADKQQLWKSQGGGDRAGEMVGGKHIQGSLDSTSLKDLKETQPLPCCS